MPKTSKRNIFVKQSINEQKLQSIINIGILPDLNREEVEAIEGHRKGDQSHLLRENYIVHKKGLIITKNIKTFDDLSLFVAEVMDACKFDFWISIEMGLLLYF